MITPADAMEVLLIVQACHRRTAPRMDDEQVTRATATVWAELFSEYKLELPDLLAAVKKRALSHADAPEPAEIIAFARDIRRDRADREDRAEREQREALLDAKAEGRLRVIDGYAAGFGLGKLNA